MASKQVPSFKQTVRSDSAQIGVRTQFCSPIVAGALGFCGYDYVYIATERSSNEMMSAPAQALATVRNEGSR